MFTVMKLLKPYKHDILLRMRATLTFAQRLCTKVGYEDLDGLCKFVFIM